MASEITFFGDEKIQFLSSVSLSNLRQALGENFLDSDSEYEDYTVILVMAVRIFYTNPISRMRRTCRMRISPLDG